jgi:hypothetical protein
VNSPYPLHFEACGAVAAQPAALFEQLDDPLRLSSHMRKKSMAMMGSSMQVETDERGGRALGSMTRMAGRVLGIPLGLEQVVVLREPPVAKTWETVGQPRLLVIGAYRMGFTIEARGAGSQLTVFIDYGLPALPPGRWLGQLLGGAYARWCCERMVLDAQAAMGAGPQPLPGSTT